MNSRVNKSMISLLVFEPWSHTGSTAEFRY